VLISILLYLHKSI